MRPMANGTTLQRPKNVNEDIKHKSRPKNNDLFWTGIKHGLNGLEELGADYLYHILAPGVPILDFIHSRPVSQTRNSMM